MHRTDPQFKLRLPQELKDRLDEIATQNRRSTTAEIVARLEESLAREAEPVHHTLTYTISKEKLAQPSAQPELQDPETDVALQALERARQTVLAARARQLTATIIADVLAGAVLSERGFSVDITESMKVNLEALAYTKGSDAGSEYAQIMEQVAKIIEERQALAGDHTETTSRAED
ncbi:Arc family DNA-binding protein [uncultured Pseudomonas sp.]|uniref:Arc family DNA-binding protein n=1 Tax=uncultured Pseudomonas sp. TaxID=114707 RepID=UPI0025E64151|nr:Arc family DNA-binding protein [uncultured Pseudomonas sp.]